MEDSLPCPGPANASDVARIERFTVHSSPSLWRMYVEKAGLSVRLPSPERGHFGEREVATRSQRQEHAWKVETRESC
jgi:hypothetical protein